MAFSGALFARGPMDQLARRACHAMRARTPGVGIVRRPRHEYAARMYSATARFLRAHRHRAVVVALVSAAFIGACRSSTPATSAPAVSADTWATVDGREITRDE